MQISTIRARVCVGLGGVHAVKVWEPAERFWAEKEEVWEGGGVVAKRWDGSVNDWWWSNFWSRMMKPMAPVYSMPISLFRLLFS